MLIGYWVHLSEFSDMTYVVAFPAEPRMFSSKIVIHHFPRCTYQHTLQGSLLRRPSTIVFTLLTAPIAESPHLHPPAYLYNRCWTWYSVFLTPKWPRVKPTCATMQITSSLRLTDGINWLQRGCPSSATQFGWSTPPINVNNHHCATYDLTSSLNPSTFFYDEKLSDASFQRNTGPHPRIGQWPPVASLATKQRHHPALRPESQPLAWRSAGHHGDTGGHHGGTQRDIITDTGGHHCGTPGWHHKETPYSWRYTVRITHRTSVLSSSPLPWACLPVAAVYTRSTTPPWQFIGVTMGAIPKVFYLEVELP